MLRELRQFVFIVRVSNNFDFNDYGHSSENRSIAAIVIIQLMHTNLNKTQNVLFIRTWRADYWTCSSLEQEKDMCHGHKSGEKIYQVTFINELKDKHK